MSAPYPFSEPWADWGYQRRWNTQRIIRTLATDVQAIYPITRQDVFVLRDYHLTNPTTGEWYGAGTWGFGLIEDAALGNTKRWQYGGLKTTYGLLDDAIFFTERNIGSNNKCYEYMKEDGQKVAVAWSTSWTNQTTYIPTSTSSSQQLYIDGNVAGTYSSFTTPLTFSQEQRYVVTADADHWYEAEDAYTSWTKTIHSHSQCYNGRYLNIYSTSAVNRWMYYQFNLPTTGTYAVYLAATPPNANWASPYKYAFRHGTYWDGGSMVSSTTNATITGKSYGVSNALYWTHLGDFQFSQSGPALLTIRVHEPRSMDGKYSFLSDAVYVEKISD